MSILSALCDAVVGKPATPVVHAEASRSMTLAETKGRAEKSCIAAAIVRCEGNISRAARELDISRMTLYRLMDKHGLRGGE
jgi:transcriptional regulator of acetoin/glycerol metabolism